MGVLLFTDSNLSFFNIWRILRLLNNQKKKDRPRIYHNRTKNNAACSTLSPDKTASQGCLAGMLPFGIADHVAKRKNYLEFSSIWFPLHRLWSIGNIWTLEEIFFRNSIMESYPICGYYPRLGRIDFSSRSATINYVFKHIWRVNEEGKLNNMFCKKYCMEKGNRSKARAG